MKPKTSIYFLLLTFLTFSLGTNMILAQSGNILAPPGTPQIPSDYVDPTIPDDPVFIFCSPDQNGDSILGTLSVQGGSANCNYLWGLFDPEPLSGTYQQFVPFQTGPIPTGTSSTITDLESGFYQVIIITNQGLPNETTEIRRAHVFINKSIVDFDPISAGCNPFTITGGIIDEVEDFTIYDPPTTPFIIDSTTTFEVCFWADHTYVSDLGFYMVSPLGKRIDLLPPNSAWNQGSLVTELDISSVSSCSPADFYTNCNSGNNVNNFCFTSTLPAGNNNYTACVCDMGTPLTGTFASCEEFNELYGDEATGNGWGVTIFDCFAADFGSLQRVTLSISGQSPTGPSNFFFDSGSINVSINDGACNSTTATTYYLPANSSVNHIITNTVTAEWNTYPIPWDPAWGSQDFNLNPTPIINPQPFTSTMFCLTIMDHLFDSNGIEITNYIPCSPQVCRYFETLPTDPTVINPPTEVCQNSAPIQLVPLFAGGTWTSNGGVYDPPNNYGSLSSEGLFVPEYAWLGPTLICHAFGGVCADDTCFIIQVIEAPQVSNESFICNGTNTQYQVCYDITGGNLGSYLVTDANTGLPAMGTFNGNTWCSDWMTNSMSYSFIFTDTNNCDPQTVLGFYHCSSNTYAGDMPQALIEVCAFDAATSIALSPGGVPSWYMDSNDGFEYYLHTDSLNNLGTILDHNTSGTFYFNSSMVYGQIYYISQVVGNNIGTPGSHVVDLADPFLSVAEGTPVIWFEFPTANAGINNYACGLTTTLNADTPMVGTGTWTCMSTANVIFSPSFNDPAATAIVPNFDTNQYGCQMNTQYVFRWTVENGQCSTFDDVTITFKPQPIANAGTDITVCGLQADLNATYSLCGPQGVSNGIWSGNATFAGTLSPTTSAGVYSPGVYTLTWIETNDQCESTDYVTVTFLEQPIVDAGYNDSVCGNTYTLNAISTIGTGQWTGPLGAIYTDQTSPNTSVEVIFTPGQSELAAVFTWTETNVICSASDDVTIVFSQQPNAIAGIDNWTCGTCFNLDADILGHEYAMGTWSSGFPGVVFDNSHDPNAAVCIPNTSSIPGQPLSGSFGDSSYVSFPITWEMNNDQCIDQDEMLLTFYQIPVAYAGVDSQICGKVFQMNAQFSIGASVGKWTMVSGPSSIPPAFTDDTDPNTVVAVPLHGEYVFEWRESNIHNQTCSTSEEVNIHFIAIPDPYAGPDKTVCGNETYLEATLNAGVGYWVSMTPFHIIDGNDPNSSAVVTNLATPETYTYIWYEINEYNGTQCVGFDSVLITYVPIPDMTITEIDSGDVELDFTGGFPPFELLWSNGETVADLFNLLGGLYYASLTDSYGCITIDSIDIAFPFSIDDLHIDSDNSILFQNIPNPFKNETEFSFYIDGNTMVKISIYDILGNEIDIVVYQELSKGKHIYKYSGDLPSGTYFYRMVTETYSQTRKMVITRE